MVPLSRPAVKKSSARIPCAWDRGNSAQPGPSRCGAGPVPALLRICHTVDGATEHGEPGGLAVNAAVTPGLVLPARPPQQRHGPCDDEEDQLQAHKPKIITRPREREPPHQPPSAGREQAQSADAPAQVAQVAGTHSRSSWAESAASVPIDKAPGGSSARAACPAGISKPVSRSGWSNARSVGCSEPEGLRRMVRAREAATPSGRRAYVCCLLEAESRVEPVSRGADWLTRRSCMKDKMPSVPPS